MSLQPHQITITGLVLRDPDHDEPDSWPIASIIEKLVPESINIQSAPLTANRTEKRVYSCSICGGRHPSNRCPSKEAGQ